MRTEKNNTQGCPIKYKLSVTSW